MNVLDLFSGIGGFSLGLERAGMRTVGFCEIDLYCQRVLMRHWPDVHIFGDVRWFARHEGGLMGERWSHWKTIQNLKIDLICGGFPCQDISVAGKGAGIEGSRSGLWSEFARIIGEVRPRYVIVENVAALLGRGLGRVLGDLAALGYDAEWHCIPASAVGAPHRRDRVWIIAHGDKPRLQGSCDKQIEQRAPQFFCGRQLGHSDWWLIEPDVGRVAHGVPFRVDRLRSLGNAIVPQIAEIIGKAIMEID